MESDLTVAAQPYIRRCAGALVLLLFLIKTVICQGGSVTKEGQGEAFVVARSGKLDLVTLCRALSAFRPPPCIPSPPSPAEAPTTRCQQLCHATSHVPLRLALESNIGLRMLFIEAVRRADGMELDFIIQDARCHTGIWFALKVLIIEEVRVSRIFDRMPFKALGRSPSSEHTTSSVCRCNLFPHRKRHSSATHLQDWSAPESS